MNFPHLKDTSFPDLNTVDVYQYQNSFDYTRWSEDTKIKLVNVIWHSDYKDVVKFSTNIERDKYFNSMRDYYALELSQAARIVPENYVKLPIPYDVMARYNYLFIDLPIATSPDAPIDYENSAGVRRWYFFIQNIAYLSPNSTQVFLSLDVWTNFQNDIAINYLLLERGHAPVAVSDTDSYLQNPIGNNRYLLAPDVNFDNASITRSSEYVPFGNGSKYVCIASTCAPEQIAAMGTVTTDEEYAPFSGITYSDIVARYGHQLQVHGLTLGNGRDYSNAKTPAKVGATNNGFIPNNLTVYAIEAEECYSNGTFFTDVIEKCPQFLNTVKACFVVDGACLTFSTTHSIAGHYVRKCEGTQRNLLNKQLQKSDFNYPQELQRFAKLYTSPYAQLEITDNDGTTYTVNIEETSTLQVKSVVSVAFPYIDYRVYIDGIGGVGSKSYSWVDLKGNSANLNMPNSDWMKYCFDWDIPTFALFMDGETAYNLTTFNRNIKQGINNALVAYHNSMRSANTDLANATDSADTALSNVYDSTTTAKTNADASADTGKVNADNSADTMKTNTDASADTTHTNIYNTCATIRENMDLAIANTTDNEEFGIQTSILITDNSNSLSRLTVNNSNTASIATTETQNETTTATTGNNAINSIGSGATGGIMGGAGLGMGIGGAMGSVVPGLGNAAGAVAGAIIGGIGGAIIGGIGGAITAFAGQSNASVAMQANTATTLASTSANGANAGVTATYANSSQTLTNTNRRYVYQNNNDLADAQTDNNNDNDKTNADNVQATTKANATRAQNTAKTNATNTQTTSKANAQRNYNNDRNNALRTRNTGVANSQYTREVAELNAKELLENAARNAMAGVSDARNASPITIGDTTGNAAADYMRTRGVQIKVKTQSDSAIRQTGDTFARYGYALNQIWDVNASGLCLMRNFTYWKAADIWIDDRQSSNNSIEDFFTRMFINGVTVWSDPEKLGRISVYDN